MILYHGSNVPQEWDIIVGPVANDQTASVIDLFLDGMYDEQEAIRRLLPQKLKDQYAFKTARAIHLLRCKKEPSSWNSPPITRSSNKSNVSALYFS